MDDREIVSRINEVKQQAAALELICAVLLRELSLLDKRPDEKLRAMVADIHDIADRIARPLEAVGGDLRIGNQTIERVCGGAMGDASASGKFDA